MKLDLYTNLWMDIVFQYRNKSYGAYDLRKSSTKVLVKSLIIAVIGFTFAVSTPIWIKFLPDIKKEDSLKGKLVAVKLQPKAPKKNEELKKIIPPPPPKPKFDQIKFVKPVVSKADDVVEEMVVVEEIKNKKTGSKTIKGDPTAELTGFEEDFGEGTQNDVLEDPNIYDMASIEAKPEFPGGMEKFYEFVGRNYVTPEDCTGGRLMITFVVEKDGSITDIKVVRDIGFGAGKEAVRVLRKCPKWAPGEQNGKKVRVQYSLPISIQAAE